MTREQREQQLVSLMLESRAALRAAYTLAFNLHPPPEMTDAEMIEEIVDIEYPPRNTMPT